MRIEEDENFPVEYNRFYGDRQLRSIIVPSGGNPSVGRSENSSSLRHHANMAYQIAMKLELIPNPMKKKKTVVNLKIQEGGTNEERKKNEVLVGEDHQVSTPSLLPNLEQNSQLASFKKKLKRQIAFSKIKVKKYLKTN